LAGATTGPPKQGQTCGPRRSAERIREKKNCRQSKEQKRRVGNYSTRAWGSRERDFKAEMGAYVKQNTTAVTTKKGGQKEEGKGKKKYNRLPGTERGGIDKTGMDKARKNVALERTSGEHQGKRRGVKHAK